MLIVGDLDASQSHDLLTGWADRHGRPVIREPTPEEVLGVLRARGWGHDLAVLPGSVRWCTNFKVHSRLVPHYSSKAGRVFLAGDACHQHSPLGTLAHCLHSRRSLTKRANGPYVIMAASPAAGAPPAGGQGMNMGLASALNLAWKLAMITTGQVAPIRTALLMASYEEERRSVEKRILNAIRAGQKGASARSMVASFCRSKGSSLVVPAMQGLVARALNMTIHSYRGGSRMVHEHWSLPPVSGMGSLQLRRTIAWRRWFGSRVHAGDRLPNLQAVPSAMDATGATRADKLAAGGVYPYTAGWMLVLCEGQHVVNSRQEEVALEDYIPATVADLVRRGKDLAARCEGLIESIAIVPSGAADEALLGVLGQSCMLVRPDAHVGLRTDPMSEGAVISYLRNVIGVTGLPGERSVSPMGF